MFLPRRLPPICAYHSISRRCLTTKVPLLLSPAEYKKLPKATTIPVDCSWHMPGSPRSSVAEYLSGPRIPNARRLDLDTVAELDIEKNPLHLGHMLPTKELFEAECKKLGIENDDHVVLYDTVGVYSSPRGAFTFKSFGHEKVSVLDGGLPRWIDEGGEVEVGELADVGESEYKVASSPADVRSYEEIVSNSEKEAGDSSAEVVVDARSKARFTGEAPEPRPKMSSGHIPNSLSLPFTEFLSPTSSDKSYTTYKSLPELESTLASSVGDSWLEVEKGSKGLVFTCGSGMTASIGWWAAQLLAEKKEKKLKTAIYDESWTGYASRPESKIVKGEK